ncbi:MAG: hypothetical protein QOF19_1417 [Alphaproteobacteria bacterium]|jgi:hypothetical protein|nr:hypothetical protein [Alphaproteobacteria bacterium]
MYRRSLTTVFFLLAASSAVAQQKTPYTAAEMQALVGKGLQINSMDLKGGQEFTGRVNLAADGRLSGTITVAGEQPIALSGGWKLKGNQLCRTLGQIQPEEVCETWLKSGPKEATVVVDGKPTSINRWQ